MSKIIQFTLDFEADLEKEVLKREPLMADFRILSESLDARKVNRGGRPHYIYKIEVIKNTEKFQKHTEVFNQIEPLNHPPIIVGTGPAGLFCALRFAEYGQPCILIERGDRASRRMLKIAKFWRYGQLDPDNNVCFGEGGAGLFSDGKLITRIKSPYVAYVMQKLVDFGAPEEVAYSSNPHLGSNKIRSLITSIGNFLESNGHQLFYNQKVVELVYRGKKVVGVKLGDGRTLFSDYIVLATGHSSKEIYHHLKENSVEMKPKDFAVGVRVEHPRHDIDSIQFGEFAGHQRLGTARYRLSYHDKKTDRGTYSFCMCPGGHVLSSGTDADGIVTNGMSNFSRNSPWSNSALVVSVKNGKDYKGDQDVLAGHYFQRNVEQKAFELSQEKRSGKEIPAQRVKDFLNQKLSKNLPKSSTPSGLFSEDLDNVLPDFITDHLREALLNFNRSMKGFISEQAVFIAPETRTSSPLTISRDRENLESSSHQGLYPCGEGAGHAGGITSAAVDGVKVAMAILRSQNRIE